MPPPVTHKGTLPTPHAQLVGANLHTPFHYSQAGDPGAVGAGKWWFNTSTNILKVRNSADSGWNAVTVESFAHNHDSDYVNVTGDTMTGNLVVNANLSADEVYVTKTDTYTFAIRKGDLANVLVVDTTNNDVEFRNGVTLIGWSGDGSGETWRIESSTGLADFLGVTTVDLTTTGNSTIGNGSTDTHTIQGRIITAGGDPAIAAGATAGTGSAQAISGDNQSGQITFTPGAGQAAGTILTITFSNSVNRGSSSNYGVWLNMRDADALTDITKVRATPSSGTQWTIVANAALNTNEHIWDYWIVER